MAGTEKWWSPRGVIKDMALRYVALPIVVVTVLGIIWLNGGFG